MKKTAPVLFRWTETMNWPGIPTAELSTVPQEFSKPEVIAVLKEYYDNLDEKVEVKLHGAATGDVKK